MALKEYIDSQFEYLQMNDESLQIAFSLRTLQRDLKEIREVFGIDIEFSKAQKGYFIVQNEAENLNFQKMLETFDVFHSLNLMKDLSPYIHLEKSKPKGTEYLNTILLAIQNRRKVAFTYQSFWAENESERTAKPLAIKEFKNRWYLLAQQDGDITVKTFAMDRISFLSITKSSFDYPTNYSVEKAFENSFGIIAPNEEIAQRVVLSFEAHQGKYIQSLPLHTSQKVILSNDTELRIELFLCITHDFVLELLSNGDTFKVVEPESLKNEIRSILLNALNRNSYP